MTVQSAQSVTVLFTTRVFATGVGTNADSLPTGALYVNGTVNAASVTVTNISTGLYKAAVTLPTLTFGDEVELAIAATVSTIADTAVIWGDTNDQLVDSNNCVKSDIVDIAGSAVSTTTAQLGVNAVKINNVAATSVTAINANLGTVQALQYDGNNLPKIDVVDWGGTAISTPPSVNATQFAGQTITAAAGVTLPSSVASPTNITAGTITTVTNLTNAATAGDLTATMKTSVTTAVNAATTVGTTSNRKKASTATFEFLMQDATTGAPKTGLTVASTISKDGGAPGVTSNSVTEIGLGQYQIVLTGTEMTANNVFLQFTSVGAVTTNIAVQTQP